MPQFQPANPARSAAPASATARRAISAFASQRKKPCTAPSYRLSVTGTPAASKARA